MGEDYEPFMQASCADLAAPICGNCDDCQPVRTGEPNENAVRSAEPGREQDADEWAFLADPEALLTPEQRADLRKDLAELALLRRMARQNDNDATAREQATPPSGTGTYPPSNGDPA